MGTGPSRGGQELFRADFITAVPYKESLEQYTCIAHKFIESFGKDLAIDTHDDMRQWNVSAWKRQDNDWFVTLKPNGCEKCSAAIELIIDMNKQEIFTNFGILNPNVHLSAGEDLRFIKASMAQIFTTIHNVLMDMKREEVLKSNNCLEVFERIVANLEMENSGTKKFDIG